MTTQDKKREYDRLRYSLKRELLIDKGKTFRPYKKCCELTTEYIDVRPKNEFKNLPIDYLKQKEMLDSFTDDERIQLDYIRNNYGEAYFQQVLNSYRK